MDNAHKTALALRTPIQAVKPGSPVHVDFADIEKLMEHTDQAWVGVGTAAEAETAAWLAKRDLAGSGADAPKSLYLYVSGPYSLRMDELSGSVDIITKSFPEAKVCWCVSLDDDCNDQVEIVVTAFGSTD